jgi:hypothetical protein
LTEIRLNDGETIVVDVKFFTMIEACKDAMDKRAMLNVFDVNAKRHFAFFVEAISNLSEKK